MEFNTQVIGEYSVFKCKWLPFEEETVACCIETKKEVKVGTGKIIHGVVRGNSILLSPEYYN